MSQLSSGDAIVTVITPTFNRAEYLAETIRSIARQTQNGIEHIVVDDGSTDDTGDVLQKLSSEIDRLDYELICFVQENMGEASAINNGWQRARGRFVTVVNSDDPQPGDWLKACVESLLANADAVVAYPDWNIIDSRGMTVHRVALPPYERRQLIEDARCLPGPGAVIRRSLVPDQQLRRARFQYVSDYDCWLRLSLRGPFVHVAQASAQWRDHSGGLSATVEPSYTARELLEMFREFFAQPLPPDVASMRSVAEANAAYGAARTLWRTRPVEAFRYLRQAFFPLMRAGRLPLSHLRDFAARRFR